MVWAKITDTFHDDPNLLKLPRDDRLFLVEATTYCCKHETDGLFPVAAVGRFSDTPSPELTLARLVEAGLLVVLADEPPAYEIVGFLEDQRSKADITRDRERWKANTDRKRRHDRGDHSTCLRGRFCPQGALDRHGNVIDDTSGDTRVPVPSRPVREREGKGADAPPPKGSAAVAPGAELLIAATVRAFNSFRGPQVPKLAAYNAKGGVQATDDETRLAEEIVRTSSSHREAAERLVAAFNPDALDEEAA